MVWPPSFICRTVWPWHVVDGLLVWLNESSLFLVVWDSVRPWWNSRSRAFRGFLLPFRYLRYPSVRPRFKDSFPTTTVLLSTHITVVTRTPLQLWQRATELTSQPTLPLPQALLPPSLIDSRNVSCHRSKVPSVLSFVGCPPTITVVIRTPFQPLTRAMLTSSAYLYLKLYFLHLLMDPRNVSSHRSKVPSVLSFVGCPPTITVVIRMPLQPLTRAMLTSQPTSTSSSTSPIFDGFQECILLSIESFSAFFLSQVRLLPLLWTFRTPFPAVNKKTLIPFFSCLTWASSRLNLAPNNEY
jgi:hypothetical protein